MEPTHVQETSSSSVGGHPLGAGPSKAGLPTFSSPSTSTTPQEQLANLTQQVQALIGVVRELKEHQPAAARRQEGPSIPPQDAAPASQQSMHKKSSQREHPRHQGPSGHRYQGTAKRPRSPAPPSGGSRRCRGREPRGSGLGPPRYSSSSSELEGEDITDRVERRLEEQDRRLEELSQKLYNSPGADYDTRPPLSRRIMEEPIPPRFRLPQLDLYDGTTDPLDHLESYKSLMQVQGATDTLLCVAFPATLRKAARAWYSRLPPRSIDSFRQLEKAFLAKFDACRKIPRVADSLFSVQQGEGELLKDFIARFKAVALEVYHLNDAVATLALKRGLCPSRFTYSLDKKPPTSYAELLD